MISTRISQLKEADVVSTVLKGWYHCLIYNFLVFNIPITTNLNLVPCHFHWANALTLWPKVETLSNDSVNETKTPQETIETSEFLSVYWMCGHASWSGAFICHKKMHLIGEYKQGKLLSLAMTFARNWKKKFKIDVSWRTKIWYQTRPVDKGQISTVKRSLRSWRFER